VLKSYDGRADATLIALYGLRKLHLNDLSVGQAVETGKQLRFPKDGSEGTKGYEI